MRRGMIGLAVFLAAAAVGYAQERGPREGAPRAPGAQRQAPVWQQMIDDPELARTVGFSPAEVEQLRRMVETHRQKMEPLREQMRAAQQEHREEMMNLIGEERAGKLRAALRERRQAALRERRADDPPHVGERPRRERPEGARRPDGERPRRRAERDADDGDDE